MWPTAIVALMVGGPLGVCLFLAAGVTHYMKVNKVDAEYAKRGEMPPTARLVEAWLNRQKASGKQPATATVKPYGSRAYAKQRWSAFWEDLGAKHTESRAAHKQAVTEAKKNGTPPPAKPTMKERLAGWKWSIENMVRPEGRKPTSSDPFDPADRPAADGPRIACDECGVTLANLDGGYQHPTDSTCPKAEARAARQPRSQPEPETAQRPVRNAIPRGECPRCGKTATLIASGWCEDCTSAHPFGWCPDCNGAMRLDGNEWLHGSYWPCTTRTPLAGNTITCSDCRRILPVHPAVAGHLQAKCGNCGTVTSRNAQPTSEPVRSDSRTPEPDASPTRAEATTEGDTMTTTSTQPQQTGEVVGLQSAINYADAVAAAHAQHSTGGGEQYRASLAGFKVGPETIQSAASAQELSEMAAGAWRTHAEKLREQMAAKEHTTAETGTKEFLLND